MYDTFDLGDWEACTTDVSPDVTPVSPPCEPTLKPSPKKSSRPQRRTEGLLSHLRSPIILAIHARLFCAWG